MSDGVWRWVWLGLPAMLCILAIWTKRNWAVGLAIVVCVAFPTAREVFGPTVAARRIMSERHRLERYSEAYRDGVLDMENELGGSSAYVLVALYGLAALATAGFVRRR